MMVLARWTACGRQHKQTIVMLELLLTILHRDFVYRELYLYSKCDEPNCFSTPLSSRSFSPLYQEVLLLTMNVTENVDTFKIPTPSQKFSIQSSLGGASSVDLLAKVEPPTPHSQRLKYSPYFVLLIYGRQRLLYHLSGYLHPSSIQPSSKSKTSKHSPSAPL